MTSPAPLNFLVISTILLGMINLVAPFFTREDSKIRSFFSLSISVFFLINVVLIDYLFIQTILLEPTLKNLDQICICNITLLHDLTRYLNLSLKNLLD